MVINTLKKLKKYQKVELEGKVYVVLSCVDLKFFGAGKGYKVYLEKV